MNASELRERIGTLPRYHLAHLPTPLELLPRFSRELGGPQIFMKRDDCTGLALGGNKARHNEFLLGKALGEKADLLVWGGGVQSNNCRQTAAACAKAGIDCHLVLLRPKSTEETAPLQGNFLLDHLLGASYEFADVNFGEQLDRRVAEVAARFESQGRNVFRWNRAVVTPPAAVSYVECLLEIIEQSRALGFVPDAIYLSSAGSTGAGTTLGARALGYVFPVRNIAYVRWEWDAPRDMATIANEAAAMLDISDRLSPDDIDVSFDHIVPGYGRLSRSCVEAISLLARAEGILLDPIYTGKAMGALIEDVRKGQFSAGQRVVFIHTGGTPALFAYGEEFAERLPPKRGRDA